MKKLSAILTAGILALFATGCDANLDLGDQDNLRSITIDGIHVNPNGWEELWFGSDFDCMYADIEMPEFTENVLSYGFFFTYFKWLDGNYTVQEGEGMTVDMGSWSYTLNCEYSYRNMRITIRPSNGRPFYPDETMNFRTLVIF